MDLGERTGDCEEANYHRGFYRLERDDGGACAASGRTQQGCMNDAFRLCQDAIPDRERVFQCLASHKNLLSAACHAALAPSSPVDKRPLKKEIRQTNGAKGKTTPAKHIAKAVPHRDRRPLSLLPH